MTRICMICGEKEAVDKCRTKDGQTYWLCADCIRKYRLETISLKARLRRAKPKILEFIKEEW